MKETLFSGLKKIAVMLIASVMLVGLVPVGMIAKPTTVQAEGEFFRLAPVAEAFVSTAKKQTSMPTKDNPVLPVGGTYESRLCFDLSQFAEKDPDTIRQVTLRLAPVWINDSINSPIQFWLNQTGDLPKSNLSAKQLTIAGGVLVATKLPKDLQTTMELDLTPYVQHALVMGETSLSLRMTALGDRCGVQFAPSVHPDQGLRPCLKIMTEAATDPDNPDLTKASLEEGCTVDEDGNPVQSQSVFSVGGGKETYLRFQLHQQNIQGTIQQAELDLSLVTTGPCSPIIIDHVSGMPWENPQVRSSVQWSATDAPRLPSFDLTDLVYDAFSRGETLLTLRLRQETETALAFSAKGPLAPRLRLQVTDDIDISAIMEAGLHALGENPSWEEITKDLPDQYVNQQGGRANLSWSFVDTDQISEDSYTLTENGKISRPAWFMDKKTILATATISAGKQQRSRQYRLSILPETPPDYSDASFDHALTLGSYSSEARHRFEFYAAPAHVRWMGRRPYSYRTLEKNGVLVLNLKTTPHTQNYITLKIRGEDLPDVPLLLENLQDPTTESILLSPYNGTRDSNGFLYLTYPLPKEYTQNRSFVSLRLTCPDATEKQAQAWELYHIYTSQSHDLLSLTDTGDADNT